MVEEPTDDRENAEADEDGASAPVPEKVGEYHLFARSTKFCFVSFLSLILFRKRLFDVSMKAFTAFERVDGHI